MSNTTPSQVVRNAINSPVGRISTINNQSNTSSAPIQGPVQQPSTPSQVVRDAINRPVITPSTPSSSGSRISTGRGRSSSSRSSGSSTSSSQTTPSQDRPTVEVSQTAMLTNPNLSRLERVRNTDFSSLARQIEQGTAGNNSFVNQNRELVALGTGVVGGLQSQGQTLRNLITNPLTTLRAGAQNIGDFIRSPISSTRAGFQAFRENPASSIGSALAGAGTGTAAVRGVQGAARAASNQYVRVGSTFVDPQTLTSRAILEQRQQFPTTSSTSESIAAFQNANNRLTTASPQKIAGNEAGRGRKGGVLEDPGIYVTPADQTSIAFTRVQQQPSTTYSLNPFAGISTRIPTITEFQASGVARQPRNVVSQPGFSATEQFFREQAGSGKAFITKRSEIGQGEIPRQRFEAPEDYTSDFPLTVQRNGVMIKTKEIKKRDIITEAGTSELEAIIPVSQTFTPRATTTIAGRFKGFDEFTTINGRNVAIRKADLDVNSNMRTPSFDTSSSFNTNRRSISANRIRKEQQSVSSIQQNSQVRSPTPSILSSSITPRNSNNSFLNSNTNSTSKSPLNSNSMFSGISNKSNSPIENSGFPTSNGSSNSNIIQQPPSGGGSGGEGGGGSSFTPSGGPGRSSFTPSGGPGGSSFTPSGILPRTPTIAPPNIPRDKKTKEEEEELFGKSKTSKLPRADFAGSLTGLVRGLEESGPRRTTGLDVRGRIRRN